MLMSAASSLVWRRWTLRVHDPQLLERMHGASIVEHRDRATRVLVA